MLSRLNATPLKDAYSWGVTKYKSKRTRWGMRGVVKAVIDDKEYTQRTWIIDLPVLYLMIETGWDLRGMKSGTFSENVGKFFGLRVAIL